MRCGARWELGGGCEGRGSCTSEKQLGVSAARSLTPLPAASQLAPSAAHAARGLSGGRQPPRRRRQLGRSDSSGDSGVEPIGRWKMDGAGAGGAGHPGVNPPPTRGPEHWTSARPRTPLHPHPGTLPSHPQDPEVKLLEVTAQRRRCAPPRPSGHCGPAGSPGARRLQGGSWGRGGEGPRGTGCRAGPSLPGCPLVTTMETSRSTDLAPAEERAALALPATAAGCHCSRAAEPAGARPRE